MNDADVRGETKPKQSKFFWTLEAKTSRREKLKCPAVKRKEVGKNMPLTRLAFHVVVLFLLVTEKHSGGQLQPAFFGLYFFLFCLFDTMLRSIIIMFQRLFSNFDQTFLFK